MKNLSKLFAVAVAITATILLGIEVANYLHMMSANLNINGHELVNMTNSEAWDFVPIVRDWFHWIVMIVSPIFLVIAIRSKRINDESEDGE